MPTRILVAAIIYPLVQSSLTGLGVVIAAMMADADMKTLLHVFLAGLVLACPLSLAMAPALMSRREQREDGAQ